MADFNVDWDKVSKAKLDNGDMIPMGSDSEFHAEFTMEKVPNFEGTDFAEVPHLKLQAPGDTKAIYHQPVRLESYPGRPSDPERFPQQWAAFQAGQNHESGTSIYTWEGVTPADARRFDLNGIKTVEQLAHVSDTNLAGLGMGALALREKARQFISGNSVETQLRQQLGDQEGQIAKLTDIVNQLLEERTQPARGRSKKETVDG
jgi:hypothetical protein